MEKLTKLVSISMWYGGPSCVLYWKKRADEVCGLQQKWVTKLLQHMFCPPQYLVHTGECYDHFNIYSIFNHVLHLQGKIIINIWELFYTGSLCHLTHITDRFLSSALSCGSPIHCNVPEYNVPPFYGNKNIWIPHLLKIFDDASLILLCTNAWLRKWQLWLQ